MKPVDKIYVGCSNKIYALSMDWSEFKLIKKMV